MSVIKFLRDWTDLFNWSTDENPTTQQDYQEAVKNWIETEKNIVDSHLWQPETEYAMSNVVKTPSLPSQYCLLCISPGTSGATEPSYTDVDLGDIITDGTVTWKVRTVISDGVFLPLAGGTMTGAIMSETNTTDLLIPYIQKFTDVTRDTATSNNVNPALVRSVDKDGNELVSVATRISTDNELDARLYAYWNNYRAGVDLANGGQGTVRFIPNNDNAYTLGESSHRWKQLYAGTSTINTSDERLKDNISAIPNDVLDAWGEVGWYQFQFKDAVAEKGENARIHCGAIAQRIKSVFESHGLNAFRYGLLCYDEWKANDEHEAGNLYSLRYEEALCMEAAYQRRRADRLEERIARLEALIRTE